MVSIEPAYIRNADLQQMIIEALSIPIESEQSSVVSKYPVTKDVVNFLGTIALSTASGGVSVGSGFGFYYSTSMLGSAIAKSTLSSPFISQIALSSLGILGSVGVCGLSTLIFISSLAAFSDTKKNEESPQKV